MINWRLEETNDWRRPTNDSKTGGGKDSNNCRGLTTNEQHELGLQTRRERQQRRSRVRKCGR